MMKLIVVVCLLVFLFVGCATSNVELSDVDRDMVRANPHIPIHN